MLDIKIVIITISHRYEDIVYLKIVVRLAFITHFSVQFTRSFASVSLEGETTKCEIFAWNQFILFQNRSSFLAVATNYMMTFMNDWLRAWLS